MDNQEFYLVTTVPIFWRQKTRKKPQNFDQEFLKLNMLNQSVEWRLSPPSAPYFGGAWEKLLKLSNELFSWTLVQQNWRGFSSLLSFVETEDFTNSRPLTHVRSDNKDEDPLTPTTLYWAFRVFASLHLQQKCYTQVCSLDASKTDITIHLEQGCYWISAKFKDQIKKNPARITVGNWRYCFATWRMDLTWILAASRPRDNYSAAPILQQGHVK